MITTTKNTATVSKVMALGLLLATLLTMALSSAPADAAVPAGSALAWGENYFGQLGNGNTGTDSDVPVAVKDLANVTTLSGVKNLDGGYTFTLASTQ